MEFTDEQIKEMGESAGMWGVPAWWKQEIPRLRSFLEIAARQNVQWIGPESGIHKVQCEHCGKITEFEVSNRPIANASH